MQMLEVCNAVNKQQKRTTKPYYSPGSVAGDVISGITLAVLFVTLLYIRSYTLSNQTLVSISQNQLEEVLLKDAPHIQRNGTTFYKFQLFAKGSGHMTLNINWINNGVRPADNAVMNARAYLGDDTAKMLKDLEKLCLPENFLSGGITLKDTPVFWNNGAPTDIDVVEFSDLAKKTVNAFLGGCVRYGSLHQAGAMYVWQLAQRDGTKIFRRDTVVPDPDSMSLNDVGADCRELDKPDCRGD
jgi:hypothetical protein